MSDIVLLYLISFRTCDKQFFVYEYLEQFVFKLLVLLLNIDIDK